MSDTLPPAVGLSQRETVSLRGGSLALLLPVALRYTEFSPLLSLLPVRVSWHGYTLITCCSKKAPPCSLLLCCRITAFVCRSKDVFYSDISETHRSGLSPDESKSVWKKKENRFKLRLQAVTAMTCKKKHLRGNIRKGTKIYFTYIMNKRKTG